MKAQAYVEDYFNWVNALERITVGEIGFMIAIREKDGIVLTRPDDEMESQPAEALDIRLKGQRTAASFKDLQDAFGEPGQAVEIRAGEEKYLAARVSFPGVLIIAFRPMQEIQDSIAEDTARLFCLTAVISGLYALYAFFHTGSIAVPEAKAKKRIYLNRSLSSRLKVFGAAAIVFVFAFGIFLMTLSAFSDTFVTTRAKARAAEERLHENEEAISQLDSWFRDEYTMKCAIAKYIVENTEPEILTREYLMRRS